MVKIRYLLLLLSEGLYRIRFIVVKSLMEEATYKEIQEYVKNKYDLHVTNLYIAQDRINAMLFISTEQKEIQIQDYFYSRLVH